MAANKIHNNMFKYFKNNINHLLPTSWSNDVLHFASKNEEKVTLVSNSITSREATKNEVIDTLVVDRAKIKTSLPWLYDLYRGYFHDVAQEFAQQKLFSAENPLYAINLNIQKRYGYAL